MSAQILENFVLQKWMKGQSGLVDIQSAVTGETVAKTSSNGSISKRWPIMRAMLAVLPCAP